MARKGVLASRPGGVIGRLGEFEGSAAADGFPWPENCRRILSFFVFGQPFEPG